MKKLKKDLEIVTKEVKALAKKTERLVKAVDKLEKAKASGKQKTKTKAKTTKKAPAKKTSAKKAAALTATDQVINIIKRAKEGIDIPTLIKKTGFEDKTIRNIVFKASKQGEIKRAGRGIYVAA